MKVQNYTKFQKIYSTIIPKFREAIFNLLFSKIIFEQWHNYNKMRKCNFHRTGMENFKWLLDGQNNMVSSTPSDI